MSEKETLRIGKGKAGPGRKPGVPNKMTGEVKAMILEALEGAGGVSYLIECANNPRTASAFLTLVGKVLPLQVENSDKGAFQTVARIELVPLSGNGSSSDRS